MRAEAKADMHARARTDWKEKPPNRQDAPKPYRKATQHIDLAFLHTPVPCSKEKRHHRDPSHRPTRPEAKTNALARA